MTMIEKLENVRYHLTSSKHKAVIDEAIELINKQQKEIDRLKMLFNDQQEIIADLEWTVENEGFKHLGKMYSELRAEAIKEFAAKLKAVYEGFDERHEMIFYSNLMKAVADLVKEMVGADNG